MNDPILQYPDFEKPFVLTTDASNVAIGSVLSQGTIGSDLPVAYASRTLNTHEQNYSTTEKELLAIVWSVKYFRPYLFGRKFTIVTDHKPLQWLFSIKEPNSKLIRWRLRLEEYDYNIVYKRGTSNTNADALSRVEININTNPDEISSVIVEHDDSDPAGQLLDIDQFINERYEDFVSSDLDTDPVPILTDSLPCSTTPIPPNTPNPPSDSENFGEDNQSETNNTVHTSQENPIVGIPISDTAVNVGFNQIILSTSDTLSDTQIAITQLHVNKQRISVKFPKNNLDDKILNFVKTYIAPKIKYLLYFESEIYETLSRVLQANFSSSHIHFVKCSKFLKDIEDEACKDKIIKTIHEGRTNHRGIDEVTKEIKELYYWPNIQKYVQDYINSCNTCMVTKYDRRPLKLQYNITPTTHKPFDTLHVDTLTLDKTKFLTIVDPFSKFAQAYTLRSCQAVEIADKLLDSFMHHGLPKLIVSDNGCEFKNAVVKELLALHKIKIHFASSQHPESNSPCERFHSTLIEHIRLMKNRTEFKKDSISTMVKYALIAYNYSIHSATNHKPIELITGHMEPNELIELEDEIQISRDYVNTHREKTRALYEFIHKKISDGKNTVVQKVNKNREPVPPDIPTDVLVRNRQKQNKTGNKYRKEAVATVNKERKTAEIQTKHHNTSGKIHLSNIKRPTVPRNFPPVSDSAGPLPSCSKQSPQ